jgi:hypothetical protein
MVEARFGEQYEDALAAHMTEQTVAGLDSCTDGDARFSADFGGQSWTSYPPCIRPVSTAGSKPLCFGERRPM